MKLASERKIISLILGSAVILGLICTFLYCTNYGRGIIESFAGKLPFELTHYAEPAIIPRPVKLSIKPGSFTLTDDSHIYVQGRNGAETDEIYKIGKYLAERLDAPTGFSLDIIKSAQPQKGCIYLATIGGESGLGSEGYHLDITPGFPGCLAMQRLAGLHGN